jgi:hypothetical protein
MVKAKCSLWINSAVIERLLANSEKGNQAAAWSMLSQEDFQRLQLSAASNGNGVI